MFTAKTRPFEEVLYGIKFTGLAMAVIYGHTDWFGNTYLVSLILMLTGLAGVIAGFLFRAKALRLYGLVLTMLCVLKLVTWDVAWLETPMRVVSLIGGGVICFLISAIYSYSVKKVNAAQQENNESVKIESK